MTAPYIASEPYTLGWWRDRAARKLGWQSQRAARFQNYYDGEAAIIALLDSQERQTFTKFLRESGANWCRLVADAVAERLHVTSFEFGGGHHEQAWAIWQASQMDADAELAQGDGLVCGSSFALVQPDEDSPTGVEISVESPFQCTVLYEPGHRRRRAAGYKRFVDDYGQTVEVLILPDQLVSFYPGADPEVADNPAGTVNLVEVRPQPRSIGPPRSELEAAIPFQDRIHTTIFNRMVATDYGAFRQIWATGMKMARETVQTPDGAIERLVKPFDVGANRLLANENPDGRFGTFAESTLAGYLSSVEQDVQQLAAVTQTPPHYLLGQMVNLSADAIKAAEAGLVAKVRRRARHIGEAWEEVMRIALGLIGDPAAVDIGAEVVWADFETRSDAQRVDALTKMATLGVPREVLWAKWGATPPEITQWNRAAAAEAAQAAVTAAVAVGAADPYTQLLQGANAAGGPR